AAALLVSDETDGAPVEAADAGDDRRIVGTRAVAVQLDPVLEQPLDVVQRVRPVLVPGELDLLPDVVPRERLGAQELDLFLHPLDLAVDAGAEEPDALQARDLLAQAQLGL